MVTQFRSKKPVEYSFHISPKYGADAMIVQETPLSKYCVVSLCSFDNLQEVAEKVRQYMEANYFTEEPKHIDLEEIWSK
jgi:hypothetical protein